VTAAPAADERQWDAAMDMVRSLLPRRGAILLLKRDHKKRDHKKRDHKKRDHKKRDHKKRDHKRSYP
jgi:hypothetical protein